jgi:hypothetical protein
MTRPERPIKVYLGDGVYAEWSEWGELILTTSDGIHETNRIVLDQSAMEALRHFARGAL